MEDTSLLTRYIPFNLTCFTDYRMFEWFLDKAPTYSNVYTLEANFIMIKKSFLTSLIMKAWVLCALDRDCIAPPGSHIYGGITNWIYGCNSLSCGCHRFDQDALTIVASYFYGFPTNKEKYPAIALTSQELYFFDVNRRDVNTYIKDQFRILFRFF